MQIDKSLFKRCVAYLNHDTAIKSRFCWLFMVFLTMHRSEERYRSCFPLLYHRFLYRLLANIRVWSSQYPLCSLYMFQMPPLPRQIESIASLVAEKCPMTHIRMSRIQDACSQDPAFGLLLVSHYRILLLFSLWISTVSLALTYFLQIVINFGTGISKV